MHHSFDGVRARASALATDGSPLLGADAAPIDRRELMVRAAGGVALAGLAATWLAGCAESREVTALPNPDWPAMPPADAGVRPANPSSGGWTGEIFPRTAWAKGAPIASRMDPMRPVKRITIHHTAVPSGTIHNRAEASQMIESVRRAHITRSGEPFGDIGYHFVIDPLGNVWEGRSLRYQGAHVAKQNEGNLGIVCMGNFETERPSPAQIASLNRFVVTQMRRYSVSLGNVRTHRELAPTACPGRNLQPIINVARARGGAMTLA